MAVCSQETLLEQQQQPALAAAAAVWQKRTSRGWEATLQRVNPRLVGAGPMGTPAGKHSFKGVR